MKIIINKARRLGFYPIILVLWSVIAAVGLIILSPQMGFMAIAIFVFIVVISLTDLFPFSSIVAVLIGVGAYFTIFTSMYSINRNSIIQIGIVTVIYAITAFLSNRYIRQVSLLEQEADREQLLMDDLILYDQLTGVLRWKYARRQLSGEVSRSRRYKKDLSLVILQPVISQDQKMNEDELNNLYTRIMEIISRTIRKDVDIPFTGEKNGIILPETNSEGAQIVCARLADSVFRKIRVDLAFGISSFPDDAVTDDDMVTNAEMALKYAISSRQSIVPFSKVYERPVENQKNGYDSKPFEQSTEKSTIETDSRSYERLAEKPVKSGFDSFSYRKQAEKVISEPETKISDLMRVSRAERKDALDKGEYFLEFYNFSSLSHLSELEKIIRGSDHFDNYKILKLKGNTLTAKVKLAGGDIVDILQSSLGKAVRGIERDDNIIRIVLA